LKGSSTVGRTTDFPVRPGVVADKRSPTTLSSPIKQNTMKLSTAIPPIIRIFSVDKAKEFYLDFLGFSLEWEHRFEKDFPSTVRKGVSSRLTSAQTPAR
jgi:hypothetical protein